MSLDNYLIFVAASIVLVIVPGPDMAYLLARCVTQGRRAGVLAAVGFNLSAYLHLVASILGLSAILATSAVAFTVIKWLGAAYLIYLGFQTLVTKPVPLDRTSTGHTEISERTILTQAFLTNLLNPKVALFFLSLLPQFVEPHGLHLTLQIVLLGMTVNVIALIVNIVLVYLSATLTESLRKNESISHWLQNTVGTLLIALGLRIAIDKP